MHRGFHRRFFARAAAVPVIPPGYTLSPVTVVQTLKNLRTTVLQTEVVTVAVPVQTTPAVVTPAASKPVVTTPAVTPTPVVTPSVASKPASPSVLSPSVAASVPSSLPSLSPSSPVISPSPSLSPSATVAKAPASVSASHSSKSLSSSAATHSATAGSDISSSATSKGLSGGAIGGIVAGFIIIALAVLVFAVRRSFLRRRKEKRDTWGAGLYPKPDLDIFEHRAPSPAPSGPIPPPPPEKPTMQQRHNLALSSITPIHQQNYQPTAVLAYQHQLPHPPASYNNPQMTPVLVPLLPTLQPSMAAPAIQLTQTPTISAPATQYAQVRCTYIPNLPDELSIATGELVRVLAEYDDGWALCANGRGEQGVVPLECLDRQSAAGLGPIQVHRVGIMAQAGYLGQGTGDWRMSRRDSSLYATAMH